MNTPEQTTDEQLFVYVSAYPSPADARADFAALRADRREGTEGGFDAALVFKTDNGEIKIRKREHATGKGMRTGVGIGLVLGAILPASIPLAVGMNTTARGAVSYLRKGMSRDDVGALGEALTEGQAALVILSDSDIGDYVEARSTRAERHVATEVEVAADELRGKLAEG